MNFIETNLIFIVASPYRPTDSCSTFKQQFSITIHFKGNINLLALKLKSFENHAHITYVLTWLVQKCVICFPGDESWQKAHDDVIKWKHLPHYWSLVREIHRSLVNSPHKGQGCGALMSSLISTRMDGWVNNREAGDLRCHRAHYNVTVINYYWPIGVLCPVQWPNDMFL